MLDDIKRLMKEATEGWPEISREHIGAEIALRLALRNNADAMIAVCEAARFARRNSIDTAVYNITQARTEDMRVLDAALSRLEGGEG